MVSKHKNPILNFQNKQTNKYGMSKGKNSILTIQKKNK